MFLFSSYKCSSEERNIEKDKKFKIASYAIAMWSEWSDKEIAA